MTQPVTTVSSTVRSVSSAGAVLCNVDTFPDIVGPLLSTVRLHPLLVTQGKDYEKTNARWKGLAEVHDVLADCSRYCVDVYESSSREEGGGVMALWSDRAEARSFGRPNSLESPQSQERQSLLEEEIEAAKLIILILIILRIV